MATEYGCKVCRVLDERGLDDYEDQLLAQWRGEDGDRKGYRQLARWLNVTLLRREMEAAGLTTLGGEATSKYDRLRADDDRASEVARHLDGEGIDVDRLGSDFVSYGVIRTHILDCLGEEYQPEESSGWETDTIEIARDHATTKIGEAVSALAGKGEIGVGPDVAVHLDVEIECGECGTRIALERALEGEESCECVPEAASERAGE